MSSVSGLVSKHFHTPEAKSTVVSIVNRATCVKQPLEDSDKAWLLSTGASLI